MTITSNEIKSKLAYALTGIKRPAQGALKHDYLVPAGPYSEQWDWDAFFMGVSLLAENPGDAIYLKNWALNYIENSAPDGKVPGCITPAGADHRLNHMKPLLAQGIFIAAKTLNDFEWIRPHWDRFKLVLGYRRENLWDNERNLGVWYDSMESGADNNVAALNFPPATVIGTDVNAFLYQEYRAAAQIAKQLSFDQESTRFSEQASIILDGMHRYLWNEEQQIFFNLWTKNSKPIQRISYSSFVPLWAGLAPSDESGKNSIARYLLNTDHMQSPWGLRTLSKQDPEYNNVNMIKPHSNWQGPIWPIANYIYLQALLQYGFKAQAQELAQSTCRLVLSDIEQSGGMHENYDAETGLPLAAPNFISWNILVRNMIDDADSGRNPFRI